MWGTYLTVRVHVWEGAGAAGCGSLYGGAGEGVGGVEGGVAQQPEHGHPAGGVLLHPGPRLLALQKVASEDNPKVRNHGESPY